MQRKFWRQHYAGGRALHLEGLQFLPAAVTTRRCQNAGEFLKHDFVVCRYTPAGDYETSGTSPQKLTLRSIAPTPGYVRQVKRVVFDSKTGSTLQAPSLQFTTSWPEAS